jgi:hypothetical protein
VVGPPDTAQQAHIRAVQSAVYRFLRYAASRSDIDLDNNLIDALVPLLRRHPGAMTTTEETVLWEGYNRLSKLVAPATDESLDIADQIRRAQAETACEKPDSMLRSIKREILSTVGILIAMVLVFIVAQAYVILLTDTLRDHRAFITEHDGLGTQIANLRSANPGLDDAAPPLQPLIERQAKLERRITVAHLAEKRLMQFWWWLYPNPEQRESFGAVGSQDLESITRLATAGYARSLLNILSQYVLPLILGLLGAIAYLVRRSLFNLAFNSYTPGIGGQFGMRLCLGGLLGVISGIMFSLDQAEIETSSLSLVVVAFLMGYSVEFAFSLFDRLIERGKSLVRPEVRSSDRPSPQVETGSKT